MSCKLSGSFRSPLATVLNRRAVKILVRFADTRQGTGNGSSRPSPSGSVLSLAGTFALLKLMELGVEAKVYQALS